jgi:hypothetical protein
MEYDVLGSRLHDPATGPYPEPVHSTHTPTTRFFNITSHTLLSIQLTVGLEAVYFHCMIICNLDEDCVSKASVIHLKHTENIVLLFIIIIIMFTKG